jgi:hypothetical protein
VRIVLERMPSAQEAREARRRKILARGSDRLAFITGELPSIPSPNLASDVVPTSSGNISSFSSNARLGDDALIRLTESILSETLQGAPTKASLCI